MWDLYNDDESFQRLARGRGFHDANLLAKVLYGKKAEALNAQDDNETKNKMLHKKCHVTFNSEVGNCKIDNTFSEPSDTSFDYLWRTKDYSFQKVKDIRDYSSPEDGVKTDVILFDRKISSEFDPEHESLKDELLAWNIRYQQRMEQKNKLDQG